LSIVPDWSPLKKIKVAPRESFKAKVEIYAIEEGGQWAASLHSGHAMKLLTGSGSLRSGVEAALRAVSGRQHIEIMTGPVVEPDAFGHVIKTFSRCKEGYDFERLRIALGLSEGGMAQKAGAWNDNLPAYKGREKKRK